MLRFERSFSLETSSGPLQNFPRLRMVDWSPRFGLAVGDNSSYRFSVQQGARAIDVEVGWDPVALLPEERVWWRLKAREFFALGDGEYPVGDAKPAYRSLSWDRDGRIWVGRYVEGALASALGAVFPPGGMPVVEPMTFDVFTQEGEYLWSLQLPHRSRILDHMGDRILVATRRLELGDQETVAVFRIVPG